MAIIVSHRPAVLVASRALRFEPGENDIDDAVWLRAKDIEPCVTWLDLDWIVQKRVKRAAVAPLQPITMLDEDGREVESHDGGVTWRLTDKAELEAEAAAELKERAAQELALREALEKAEAEAEAAEQQAKQEAADKAELEAMLAEEAAATAAATQEQPAGDTAAAPAVEAAPEQPAAGEPEAAQPPAKPGSQPKTKRR